MSINGFDPCDFKNLIYKHKDSEYDEDCKCWKIEQEINKKYPDNDWNCDESCEEWEKREKELKDNHIEFEEASDEVYGCTCPTCGRIICGQCV